jgi:hypothetical protein
MLSSFSCRVVSIVVTLGVFLSLAAFASAGQANAVDFMCSSSPPQVCLFPNDNLTGNYPVGGPVRIGPQGWTQWTAFSVVGATNPNPGSANNNTGSCMWVDDAAGHVVEQVKPHSTADLLHQFGFFIVQFGVDPCPAHAPAGAP